MNRIEFLFPSALLCLCLSGCQVPLQAYRHSPPAMDSRSNPPQLLPVSETKKPPLSAPARCDMAKSNTCLEFIQLDDMGDMLSPEELPAVLATIGRANALAGSVPQSAPIVIAFVHGWNHNADQSDSTVQGFSQFLERVSATYHARRKVVGIYIGWRGARLKKSLGMLRKFSYFDREAAAMRIPGVTLLSALTRITMRAHENRSAQVVFMGHSMGALLLERAVASTTANAIVEETNYSLQQQKLSRQAADLESEGVKPGAREAATLQLASAIRNLRAGAAANQAAAEMATSPLADLVVFVNTAAAASESIQLLNFLSSNGLRYRPSAPGRSVVQVDELDHPQASVTPDRPLFVSVTSRADKATRLGLPIGHALEYYGYKAMGSFRDDYPVHCFDPDRQPVQSWTLNNKAEGARTQGSYYLSTAPNMPLLQSHQMLKAVAPDAMRDSSTGQILKIANPDAISMCRADLFDPALKVVSTFRLPGSDTCFAIQERPNRCNGTPYWTMQVDPEVLSDHDAIFSDRFTSFLIDSFFPPSDDSARRKNPALLEAAQ